MISNLSQSLSQNLSQKDNDKSLLLGTNTSLETSASLIPESIYAQIEGLISQSNHGTFFKTFFMFLQIIIKSLKKFKHRSQLFI